MKHDLIHIQGKPYVIVPLHDYRVLNETPHDSDDSTELPQHIIDALYARQEHPVKILRQYRGLTQKDLALKADISRPYLTEIETGKKTGSIAALKSLAEALGAPLGLVVLD